MYKRQSKETPLNIRDFGVQHPFDDEDFSAAILRDGSDAGYTAGINLFLVRRRVHAHARHPRAN